jgi:hypothetical protein
MEASQVSNGWFGNFTGQLVGTPSKLLRISNKIDAAHASRILVHLSTELGVPASIGGMGPLVALLKTGSSFVTSQGPRGKSVH